MPSARQRLWQKSQTPPSRHSRNSCDARYRRLCFNFVIGRGTRKIEEPPAARGQLSLICLVALRRYRHCPHAHCRLWLLQLCINQAMELQYPRHFASGLEPGQPLIATTLGWLLARASFDQPNHMMLQLDSTRGALDRGKAQRNIDWRGSQGPGGSGGAASPSQAGNCREKWRQIGQSRPRACLAWIGIECRQGRA
jgi:hypothetical protein